MFERVPALRNGDPASFSDKGAQGDWVRCAMPTFPGTFERLAGRALRLPDSPVERGAEMPGNTNG